MTVQPTMPAEITSLPLFPLHSVLLPGATIGLRVFERRYLDLVRDCGRTGSSFGVCLILDGSDVGAPAPLWLPSDTLAGPPASTALTSPSRSMSAANAPSL